MCGNRGKTTNTASSISIVMPLNKAFFGLSGLELCLKLLICMLNSAAPLVWLDIVKNEILQESQKTNSARNWPISPFFSPASHFFMLKGPNYIFKFMKGQPYNLQSLQKGQKLTEYNLFMDRRMHSHTISLFVW